MRSTVVTHLLQTDRMIYWRPLVSKQLIVYGSTNMPCSRSHLPYKPRKHRLLGPSGAKARLCLREEPMLGAVESLAARLDSLKSL